MSLRVLHPGTFSLLVDRGRLKTRNLGVALGGAADMAAYAIGNALAGNLTDAVALEITLSGPTLFAEHETSACVFGAPFTCSIDGRRLDAGNLFHIKPGETLKIGGTVSGARAYLCVKGGFQTRTVLSSGSAFAPIAGGELLMCERSNAAGRSVEFAEIAAMLDESASTTELRAIDGPQSDWFSYTAFFENSYTVSPACNRMGVRLQGDPLVRQPREMVSEAVAPGAVQITNEGLPIILGVDGQTIGGYPKIAHVIRADLDRIGQLRPGQVIRFVRTGLDEAETLARKRNRKLRKWLAALKLAAI